MTDSITMVTRWNFDSAQ